MTNGEKFKEMFSVTQVDDCDLNVYAWLPNHNAIEIPLEWWNAEYKEPTSKNDLGVDAVNRATVLHLINDVNNSDGFKDYSQYEYLFDQVDMMPSVTPQEPKWIPVRERLPEIHNYTEKYFVTLERGWVHTAIFTECDGNHWWSYDDVVAWMPLPKAYREVEE